VKANAAEGIENHGANTIKKNQVGLANDGTGTESGNSFGTGGWTTAPEVDEPDSVPLPPSLSPLTNAQSAPQGSDALDHEGGSSPDTAYPV